MNSSYNKILKETNRWLFWWLLEDGYDCAYAFEDSRSCTATTSVTTNNDDKQTDLNPTLNLYYGIEVESDAEDMENVENCDITFQNVKVTENPYYEWSYFF